MIYWGNENGSTETVFENGLRGYCTDRKWQDYGDYKEICTVRKQEEEQADAFEKLKLLLDQGEFELLADQAENGQKENYRLVYLMNDTVESFLVLENCRLTGEYQKDYEGDIEAELREYEENQETKSGDNRGNPSKHSQKEYVLVVHQGGSVCTLLFTGLKEEVHLYNYGEIGHFWVKGYEYLRQLEYTFAILRDKREYLGDRYCNKRERKLAALADFPPLNYTCYPAVSSAYLVEREHPWNPTRESIQVMVELLEEVGDKQLLKLVRLYAMFPVKVLAKYIAMQLHRKKHKKVAQALLAQVRQASKGYLERKFSGKEEKKFREQRKRAQECAAQWKEKGYRTDIFREEPFVASRDSVEGKYYVMIWKKAFLNQKVKIEEIL